MLPDDEVIYPVGLPHAAADKVGACRECDRAESLGGEVDGVGDHEATECYGD